MQWTAGENAGFTTGTPWLGVNGNYKEINCAAQKNDPDSILNWYKELIAMRRGSDVLRGGEFIPVETGTQVFAYHRRLRDKQLTVILNFSDRPASCAQTGALLKSNYPRRAFDGTLSPWEAVILG